MAFAKKVKVATQDGRPQMSKEAAREHKINVLKAANNSDARTILKRMNDKVYRGSRSNLGQWYAPTGKKVTATN